MHQIRQITTLILNKHSIRSIVRLTGIARNTVREYKRRVEKCSIGGEQLLALEDEALSAIVYPLDDALISHTERWNDLQKRLPYFTEELRRRGVTRQLLWDEYKSEYPAGYGYTQFCDHLARKKNIAGATLHLNHAPGEQMMVDFAGDTLSYVDHLTGEVFECQVLVCILPYSNYTYVEPLRSQKQEDFIAGLSNALYYMGGAPQSIKCDNLKSAVIKANRYEPVFTEALQYFANYYNLTAMATRVRKPKDKASVENAVGVAYKRIYAPLRNEAFGSLEELSRAVRIQLDKHNAHFFKARDYSRKMRFEAEEKTLLKSLPDQRYVIRHVTKSKVQKNYHVIVGEDYHQYSVPYTLIGKTLKLVYTTDEVEVYHEQKRVALHRRNYKKYGYTTLVAHMPDNHVHVVKAKGWDEQYFLSQALLTGISTHAFISRILSSRSFPEQTYNSCLGILRLGKQYGADRLEAACLRALEAPVSNYGIISNILKHGLDKAVEPPQQSIPFHDNIRGEPVYQ
ncbi:MAG: IS21 family transposase [Chitinophagales bacterium]